MATLKELMAEKAEHVRREIWADRSVLRLPLLPDGTYGVWAKLLSPYSPAAKPGSPEWLMPSEAQVLMMQLGADEDWRVATEAEVAEATTPAAGS